ncbi:MAG: hypothetical protein ACPIA7_03665 [Akkermansiaceae bacterium]
MHRLLLFLSLLPLLAALVLRKLNADRILKLSRERNLSGNGEALAKRMLSSMELENTELRIKKREWAGAAASGDGWLALTPQLASGKSVADHGQVVLRVGLYFLSLRDPKSVARRRWALRFGHAFPIFTLVVCVFALLVGKLPVMWVISIAMASLGIAACAQILTLTTNLQASSMAAVVLEKKHTYPRLSDEELVVAAARAWAWHSVVPGLISRLM